MLEGKTRIPPVDIAALPNDLRETLEEQNKLFGAPLYPYLFYARHPAYFRAAKAMWSALQEEATRVPVGLIPTFIESDRSRPSGVDRWRQCVRTLR